MCAARNGREKERKRQKTFTMKDFFLFRSLPANLRYFALLRSINPRFVGKKREGAASFRARVNFGKSARFAIGSECIYWLIYTEAYDGLSQEFAAVCIFLKPAEIMMEVIRGIIT